MGTKTIVRDLTSGSVAKTLLTTAFPLMLSSLLQMTYNLVDIAVVGRCIGTAGLVAVSSGGDITGLLATFCIGFATAGQVIIAQQIGVGDKAGLSRTIGSLITIQAAMAVIVMIIGFSCSQFILELINVPEESSEMAWQYVSCCFLGTIFIFGYNGFAAILRGMGETKLPFIFILIASVTNVVLDLLFVVKLNMGVYGAAIATVIGQMFSFAACLVYLYKHREQFYFDFKPRSFKPEGKTMLSIFGLGIPLALQSAAISVSKLVINSYINAFGVAAAAISGTGTKIGQCAWIVTDAIKSSGASVIGQSFGAGKPDRVKRTVYVSLVLGVAFAVILSVFMVLFPTQIFGIFDTSEEYLGLAVIYVPIAVMKFFGNATRCPMMSLLSGLGKSSLSLAIGLLDGVIVRIFLSIYMGVSLNMGIMGFWYGDVIAGLLPFFIGGIFFWSGAWTKTKLKAV